MKRFLSTALFVISLLALGALAFLAMNGAPGLPVVAGQSSDGGDVPAQAPVLAPDAPVATNKYNFIALPLDSTPSISPFKASGLASYVGSSVKKVVRFDAVSQTFKTHTVGTAFNNFDLATGGAYLIEVDNTADTVVSFVGDVPNQGSVIFSLQRGSSEAECKYNAISVPLDRSDITNAAGLATAIGGVNKVTRWDPASQSFKTHTAGTAFNNFAVSIGYPFLVCVNSTGPASWPASP